MSSSDIESMSEGSNTMDGSPHSYADSPYNSPLQQVPDFAGSRVLYDNGPRLKIMEQPQDHFRFRYRSEMVGTHGCLLGRTNSSGKAKTHPTVELLNYHGKAVVRCSLAQVRNDAEHPHQLLEDDQEQDISAEVGPEKGYVVKFKNMGIIHTAKKDISAWLYKKFMSNNTNKGADSKNVRSMCEAEAKNINLNIVRLKFAAYDIFTGRLLCPPVFSEHIHNMKSAATNELKICRMSRATGRVKGGEDVYIFVEKVNKKNIQIRLTERDPDGQELWVGNGLFTQNDVHHQYGIMFRTPPYSNPLTPVDVKVYIQLFRPTDGKCSNALEFIYRADPVHKQCKKRKANSYSSIESYSSGSIKSVSDFLPIPVFSSDLKEKYEEKHIPNFNAATVNLSFIPQQGMNSEPLADALYNTVLGSLASQHPGPSLLDSVSETIQLDRMIPQQGMNSEPLADALYNTVLGSPASQYPGPTMPQPSLLDSVSETIQLDRMLVDTKLASDDMREFLENFNSDSLRVEYFKSQNIQDPETITNGFDLFRSSLNLVSDSAGKKKTSLSNPNSVNEDIKPIIDNYVKSSGYNAVYSKEDGAEVKKVIQQLCEMIKDRLKKNKTDEVKATLSKLFDFRLNNGDTFFHMALCTNLLPRVEFLLELIDNLDMTHLLNIGNNNSETLLHLAIQNYLVKHLDFLISKGCNPMNEDKSGNNVIHYAVIYQYGLEELLHIIKKYNAPCDLNAYNCEKQTALHLAATDGYADSCTLLLEAGADHNSRDCSGRTALHLAAYEQRLDVIRVLLDRIHVRDIDAVDGCGNTALQIVCGVEQRAHTKDLAKMLLARGADPQKCEDNNQSAWQLSHDKPELREMLRNYLPANFQEVEAIKSEDEYDSGDDIKLEYSPQASP